ncbi:hypothetical protein TrVGV298_002988 [Trichoderma virens]|nr:hypothetical protein TrVGV298_002988 [Trichoderma virens]
MNSPTGFNRRPAQKLPLEFSCSFDRAVPTLVTATQWVHWLRSQNPILIRTLELAVRYICERKERFVIYCDTLWIQQKLFATLAPDTIMMGHATSIIAKSVLTKIKLDGEGVQDGFGGILEKNTTVKNWVPFLELFGQHLQDQFSSYLTNIYRVRRIVTFLVKKEVVANIVKEMMEEETLADTTSVANAIDIADELDELAINVEEVTMDHQGVYC